MTLGKMLEETTTNNSDKIAISFKNEELAYSELQSKVTNLASNLSILNVNYGDRVGLLFNNSLEFIISFFAIARIGAIAVPLDIRYKPEELQFISEHCDIKILITANEFVDKVDKLSNPRNFIVSGIEPADNILSFEELLNRKPYQGIKRNIKPEDEALYLYTSGSTGKPKSIIRTHRNLVSEAENVSSTEGITNKDNILGVIPLFHSYGLGHCMLTSIKTGATLVLLDKFVPHEIIRIIKTKSISIFPGIPYMYELLVESYTEETSDLSSLRLCISAGAPLSLNIAKRFKNKFGVVINQHYGSSEAGAISINLNRNLESNIKSVGLPMNNVSVKIVNDQNQEVLNGESGEIIVKSDAVSKGYFRLSELNKKVFKDGWCYTGDLGKKENGYLYITGRKKNIINVAGLKVDPLEIERLLVSFPKVKEVAVIGVKDESLGESVKAIVVLKEKSNEDELFDFCGGKLADYKIPRQIEFRDALPKNSMGKILREELEET
ncbi:MAG: AMP-binding protein [bacterium]